VSDICILYARKDAQKQASRLDASLGQRWKVWWDRRIDNGDYRRAIKSEIPTAGCIVPIWSAAAENSAVLHDELQIATQHKVPIVPIRIHDVPAPFGHGSLQATDAIGWDGDDLTAAVREHLDRVDRTLEARRAGKERPAGLGFANATGLPAFFFSVSSHETRLLPGAALDALNLFGVPSILVSAYDMDRTRQTMRRIRDSLRELYFYQPIHILGTGNPASIALLTAAGADSFDGLEWCRYVLDGKTHTLHHFQHYDLYKWQDESAVSPVTRAAILDANVRYSGRAVFHNLDIYTSWLNKMRAAMRDEKRLVELMTKLLSEETMELTREALPGVL
jgi:TIR domain